MTKSIRCRFCVLAMESVPTAGATILFCIECSPAEGNLVVAARGATWHAVPVRGAALMVGKRAKVKRDKQSSMRKSGFRNVIVDKGVVGSRGGKQAEAHAFELQKTTEQLSGR